MGGWSDGVLEFKDGLNLGIKTFVIKTGTYMSDKCFISFFVSPMFNKF